jgi:hypothetical protein
MSQTHSFAEAELLPLRGYRLHQDPVRLPEPVERPRPHLVPIADAPAAQTGRPLLAALVAVGLVLAIMLVQLGLSIAISQGAYERDALEIEQRDLLRVERVLQQNVDQLSSPQNLAENAAGLGMVQNVQPASLRLSDGAVLGDLASRTAQTSPNLVPNSTLVKLPLMSAEGLLVAREADTVAEAAALTSAAPVPWKGKLPAPETR